MKATVVHRPRRDGRPRSDRAHGPSLRGRFASRWIATAGRAACLLLAGALGACGGEADSPSAPAVAPSAPARRVVSLAPSHTELLYALGAGDRVVAVTRFCDRPAEAADKPAVASAVDVNVEAVAALDPDLVLVNAEGLATALGPIAGRVPVRMVPTGSLPEALEAVTTIGGLVGAEKAAAALRSRLEATLAATRERHRDRAETRVLFVLQREPFFVAGGGSFIDELLAVLGCTNAAGHLEASWPAVSAEALLGCAPDVIIDASLGEGGEPTADDEAVAAWWSRFEGLPAVRTGRVLVLRSSSPVRPGPSLDEGLAELERLLEEPR